MKISSIVQLVSIVALVFGGGVILYSFFPSTEGNNGAAYIETQLKHVQNMIELLKIQNNTIFKMKEGLNCEHIHAVSHASEPIHASSPSLIQPTTSEQLPASHSLLSEFDIFGLEVDDVNRECERRFGPRLVEDWRKSREVWCTDEIHESELVCYPFQQKHKQVQDIFCEATNFVIDFSKIKGEVSHGKPTKGAEYLSFENGATTSACAPTKKFRGGFMNHHRLQMSKFLHSTAAKYDEVHDTPTYFLARDEDCENLFHASADFMNMFLVLSILQQKPQDLQVLLFDKFFDGPYIDLIKNAYSPKFPVLRHTAWRDKKVLFKKIIFHLESPAALIFPKVANPTQLRCFKTGLFDAYRKHILNSFGLLKVMPPPIPSILMSLRHRTDKKNVGRVMANEKEVAAVLNKANLANVKIVDMATMNFVEQLKAIRNTNILVGIHGAGLMLIMFAAEEAVLLEIHPTYRQDRHFRHAARMTGKLYLPVRASKRETCQGTSDNVMVPIDEFTLALDGAIRLARNFDSGVAECGTTCPYPVLALDKHLDSHYKAHEHKTNPINTHFPCY